MRVEVEIGLYHATVRGWERRNIVRSDRDREDWLDYLDVDRRKAPDWLDWITDVLVHCKSLPAARRAYRKFVEAGNDQNTKSLFESAYGGMLLGDESWLKKMRTMLSSKEEDPNVPAYVVWHEA